jgi:hypothetical protein
MAAKRRTWRPSRRGPGFGRALDLVNTDFQENRRQAKCCTIDIRGPVLPQRVMVPLPTFREWRLVLQGGINLYQELREDEFLPLELSNITRFEWSHEPSLGQTNVRIDILLSWLLMGLGKSMTPDDFSEAIGPDHFRQLQRIAPDAVIDGGIGSPALYQFLSELPDRELYP